MRLNKHHKDGIVEAVMDDVPSVNYGEQIRDCVMKWAVGQLPPQVRRVWDNAELRGFIRTESSCIGCRYYQLPGFPDEDRKDAETEAMLLKVKELEALQKEQVQTRDAMRGKLSAAVSACSTRKQFVEQFPEFERYAPEDQTAGTNLPAIANVVADLVKVGWPKASKKA